MTTRPIAVSHPRWPLRCLARSMLLVLVLMPLSALAVVPFQLDQVDPEDIRIQSRQAQDRVDGSVQVALAVPYQQLRALLMDRAALCDVAVLHFNIKGCVYMDQQDQALLRVFGGKKAYQAPDEAGFFDLVYKRTEDTDQSASVQLYGDDGPFGTSEYLIRFHASQLDEQHSQVEISFSVNYTQMTHWAQRMYFSSLGRHRIGFTVTGHDARGQPQYVRGMRAMVERNAMRLFLALQVALEAPQETDTEESRLRRWFALTEQYPLQLREMALEEYLDSKQREIRNQRLLQAGMGEGSVDS
jgi:hypothetical protein